MTFAMSGAGLVTVRATRREVRDPLPGRGLYKLAQHDYEANRNVAQLRV